MRCLPFFDVKQAYRYDGYRCYCIAYISYSEIVECMHTYVVEFSWNLVEVEILRYWY